MQATDSLIAGEPHRDVDEAEVTTLLATVLEEETIKLLLSKLLTHTLTLPLLHQHSMAPKVDIKASGSMSTGKRPLHTAITGRMLLRRFLRRIIIPTTLSRPMPSSRSTPTILLGTARQLSLSTVHTVALHLRRRSGRPRRALPSKSTAAGDPTIAGAIKVTDLPLEVGLWDRVRARDIVTKQARPKLMAAMVGSIKSLAHRHHRLRSTRHRLKHINMPLLLPRLKQ